MKVSLFNPIILLFFVSCENDSQPTIHEPENPFAQKEIDWPSLQKTAWPMYRHDPQLTGRSPSIGPVKGIIADTLPLYSAGTVMGNDQNVYISHSSFGKSYVSSYTIQNLQANWTTNIITDLYKNPNTPLLLANSTVLHSALQLYALDQSGNVAWNYGTVMNKIVNAVEQVDRSGNIYFIDSKNSINCISPSRQLLWTYTNQSINNPKFAFSHDGTTLYVPMSAHNSVMAFDVTTQQIKWTFGSLPLYAAPVVDNAGNIYFQKSSSNTPIDTFYCLTPSGAVRWQYAYQKGNSVPNYFDYYEPTIDHNGNLYFIAPKDTLVSTTNDGRVRWKLPLTSFNGSFSPLVCDAQNTVFLTTGDNHLIAVSQTGVVLWQVKFNYANELYNTPSVINGKLFLTANSGNIYIIE